MSFCQILNPKQKALAINLDDKIYGTLAEIGAGQEVARHFFRAGGAAGTIAKTISAYDMVVSDTIYGKEKSGRYVCEARVEKMINREFEQLIDRLQEVRDQSTRYFAFANTVAAKSFRGNRECHGWMGITYQHEAGADPSQVILHVKMLDRANLQQQEALGHIGVNLIYSAYFKDISSPEGFISSLMEGLTTDRIEIDMITTKGPAFSSVDKRLYSLELIKRQYCQAVMFSPDGKVLQASDALYKKNILISRGSFRPPTHVNVDMLKTGLENFKLTLDDSEQDNILVLPEISMNKLLERGKVENSDFLARVDILLAMGYSVLISNYKNYHGLSEYLQKYSKKQVAFSLGVYNLEEIMSLDRYEENAAGILGGLGVLFGHNTTLFLYPGYDDEKKELINSTNIKIDESLSHLIDHLKANKRLIDVTNHNSSFFHIWSRTVLKMIQNGDKAWETMVPELVVKTVKQKKLFGLKE